MASNSFGTLFRFTTWGETHGKAVGVVVDGCPAGLEISEADINAALALRAPGKSPYTSPRNEPDQCEILSGVFEGKTTGAPISILIPNKDVDSSKYEPMKGLLRPGHANFTYIEKYGHFDYRGSSRASARETACRVAAGAIAAKLLEAYGITVAAFIKQIGSVVAEPVSDTVDEVRRLTFASPIYCPDADAAARMMSLLDAVKNEGDSLAGIVEFLAEGLPAGIGDPIYGKLEALLASAMMSLPASKGFEIGSGFGSVVMKGSQSNDRFVIEEGQVRCATNHAGGTLGGISTGMPLVGRVVFKAPSSIRKPQETVTLTGEKAILELPAGSRHDPCVAIRAVPVVQAMTALVLADALLLNKSARHDKKVVQAVSA